MSIEHRGKKMKIISPDNTYGTVQGNVEFAPGKLCQLFITNWIPLKKKKNGKLPVEKFLPVRSHPSIIRNRVCFYRVFPFFYRTKKFVRNHRRRKTNKIKSAKSVEYFLQYASRLSEEWLSRAQNVITEKKRREKKNVFSSSPLSSIRKTRRNRDNYARRV